MTAFLNIEKIFTHNLGNTKLIISNSQNTEQVGRFICIVSLPSTSVSWILECGLGSLIQGIFFLKINDGYHVTQRLDNNGG